MKKLEVSCAIIVRDGLLLAAQRSEEMSMPLKWEFPGGKLHHNESADDCLVREIKEELDITIAVRFSLSPADWQYPNFAITLYPFVCDIVSGQIRLAEHKAIQWLRIPGQTDHRFRCKVVHLFRSKLDQSFRCNLDH